MPRFSRGFILRADLPNLPATALGVSALVVNDGANDGWWTWDGAAWQHVLAAQTTQPGVDMLNEFASAAALEAAHPAADNAGSWALVTDGAGGAHKYRSSGVAWVDKGAF